MQLRELKYNVFFEYIKDIRRYSYEVEDFLRKLVFSKYVNKY